MTVRGRVIRSEAGEAAVSIGSGGAIEIGGASLRGGAAGAGAWRIVEPDGWARLVYVAVSPDGWWVHLDGTTWRLEVADVDTAARSRPRGQDGDLAAPMPATVLSVVAPEGTSVRAGDVLLLLEAMKMELPIRAPRDGVVSAVRCRQGELVQPGVPLVEIA